MVANTVPPFHPPQRREDFKNSFQKVTQSQQENSPGEKPVCAQSPAAKKGLVHHPQGLHEDKKRLREFVNSK